jgi:hypothetical protein
MRLRARSGKGHDVKRAPVFLLVVYAAALASYAILLRLHFGVALPLVASVGPSGEGVFLGAFSVGYLSLAVLTLLSAASLVAWREGASGLSWQAAGAGVALGLVVGGSLTLIPLQRPSPRWLNSVQDSRDGFTLVVNYNSTTLVLGRNLTFQYVLTDDSYQLTTPYYLFGGQFSMVFYNSTGGQVVAFRAPITFNRAATQYTVQLIPGERWTTLLSWDGTVIPLNGSRYMVSPGRYTLASYAVLQDANVSLYVMLHAPDIPVTIVKG